MLQIQVIQILSEYTAMETEQINLETNLKTDLDLSSLDVINLVVTFEDVFGIEIPDEEVKRLATVKDIVNYLEKVC